MSGNSSAVWAMLVLTGEAEHHKDVEMTPDTIGLLIPVVTCAVAVTGLLATQISRFAKTFDARFARFEQVDARFAQMDARFDKGDDRSAGIQGDIVEIEVAIARLEGPTPRLQLR